MHSTERERERETDRQTDRQTETERQTETDLTSEFDKLVWPEREFRFSGVVRGCFKSPEISNED